MFNKFFKHFILIFSSGIAVISINCLYPADSAGQELSTIYPFDPQTDRDPLFPLVNEKGDILIRDKKEVDDISLQGIIYIPDGAVAIINNEMLDEGDSFEGYTVKEIKQNGVILEKDGKQFFLKWEG
ncbi:MAG: general secretion pathway protein GspB [Candidatus Omnitrophota bacterium]